MLAKQHPLIRRKIRRWISKFTLIIIVFSTYCYIYAAKIEPNWIEVVPIQLTIPNLSKDFEDFKIVQIADIHVSKFMPEQRLTKIIRLVNQQQPDAIAITGDLITQNSRFDADQLRQNLSQLQSKSGIFAVLGNHDHWGEMIALLKQVLVESNIINLDNQVYLVERGEQKLALAGIDDPYWGHPDLPKTIAQLPIGHKLRKLEKSQEKNQIM
ncbi:MAG: metallophosphoesterase [Pleurocapsa sp.]